MMFTKRLITFTLLSIVLSSASTYASEPGWSWKVITFGKTHERIKATPIHLRDYRPFHFYGNTVRRLHYHGTPLITPRVLWEWYQNRV